MCCRGGTDGIEDETEWTRAVTYYRYQDLMYAFTAGFQQVRRKESSVGSE